jgi:glycerol kinase
MSLLVIDVGTSSVRASIVTPAATVSHINRRAVLPSTPAPGFVELDARVLADAVLEVARAAVDQAGPVDAVGITNQRATTIVWDRETGEPVGPGIGWQDQRTVMMCLALQSRGLRLSPSSSATKLAFLLDTVDPDRTRNLCFGTVDTWVAWTLSGGSLHVTDLSNAGVTGLMLLDGSGWDMEVLDALRIPAWVLPRIADSSEVVGTAGALAGAPPIAGLAGDQQASLIGQGCTLPGLGKLTFGTGGMLDLCVGADRPEFERRGRNGTFPIVAWRRHGRITWGIEAFMLTAGQAVEWLRDDLGVIADVAESEVLAASCDSAGDVWFVPALLGMATPAWDFGARGTLLGVTTGTGRAEVVRAVLEGVAHRGADLLEAAEADGRCTIPSLRVDGGMSANAVFVQALADACQRPVEVSPVLEATTLGAAFLAGMAIDVWSGEDDVAATWSPRATVEPRSRPDRDRWHEACERARGWVPELSALDF